MAKIHGQPSASSFSVVIELELVGHLHDYLNKDASVEHYQQTPLLCKETKAFLTKNRSH
jgi:hypothetical protein